MTAHRWAISDVAVAADCNDLRRVRPEHIRRFAERCARGYRAKTVGDELSALRQFLRFMHLRGSISPWLPQAVPKVADYGHGRRTELLTDAQRCQFLAGFERRLPKRHRDYTMALCMLDLGLRGVEISRLRLCDIDWSGGRMTVPPAKRSPGRQLPIPPHVMQALRAYVKSRPESHHDEVFVGDKLLVGRPLSPWAVGGNDPGLSALRIFAALAWIASIAPYLCDICARAEQTSNRLDLLGHRLVTTTNRYAQVDPRGFRARAAVAEVKRRWHPCSIWSAATSPTVAGWVTNSTTQAACLPLSLVSVREPRQDGP